MPHTIHEAIQILARAKRPHLGLMENHEGRVINVRAGDFHEGLRLRNAIADFDFGSHKVPAYLHLDLPRVARPREIRRLHQRREGWAEMPTSSA